MIGYMLPAVAVCLIVRACSPSAGWGWSAVTGLMLSGVWRALVWAL